MSAPLLEVRGLTVDFLSDGPPVRAVEDVSFTVAPGETLCILGESGSGKSVTAGTIMGLIDRPPGEIAAGSIVFGGHNLATLGDEERRRLSGRDISMIFQDPLAHLNPVYPVGDQVAEVFEAHGVAHGREARQRAVELLERVGIPDAAQRAGHYPHQFSGGQRQRIMIAMAIALAPRLLIADEPTTALDVSVQAQILDLLRKLQSESGMAMILITHDLEVAAAMGDRVIVMKRGRIVEEQPAQALFEAPRHDYTRQLLAALPADAAIAGRAPATGDALLEVNHLCKTYSLSRGFGGSVREIRAVDDVGFTIARGETLGIVGESGSGKSTVARLLLRLNEPTSGTALFRGRDIFAMRPAELLQLRRRVQMVFQDPYGSLNPQMSVRDIIAEPLRIHRDILPRERWAERVAELLRLVGLEPEHASRYPHQFSGGQRQRIAIARALASDPELIVCDEAVSALDVSIQAQIIELLAGLRDRLGLSYIFITHDLPVVRHFADRVLVMKSGRLVEQNNVAALFARPADPYTKSLLAARPQPKWHAHGAPSGKN